MKVEVLGTGCHDCLELELRVAKALENLGLQDVEFSTINDEQHIRQYMPLENLPGLVINGVLVSEHEVPEVASLMKWLADAHASQK